MTFTASNRVQDNLQAVSNLLYAGVEPMTAVSSTAAYVNDGFDHHLKNLAKLRDDLTWMLAQTDAATATLEAAQAASASPAERDAKAALVAPALPKDSDFHSSVAA